MTGVIEHWAADYIGAPWVYGQSDCWHFARRVWRERFGIRVPPVIEDAGAPLKSRRAIRDSGEARDWTQVRDPQEGDGVLMAKGSRPCHVGIWVVFDPLGPGGILHSVEGAGVIYTDQAAVARLGYRIIGFYRRAL